MDIIASKATETPANLAEFMQKNQYTFPVLLDESLRVTRLYGVKSTPTNFLIDKNGVIREMQTGAFASEAAFEESLNQLLPK